MKTQAILLHRLKTSAGRSTGHLSEGALGPAVCRAPQEQAQHLSRHQLQISTFFDWFRALPQSNTVAGVSDIAQIPDGQKHRSKNNRYAIPKRSIFNLSCTGTHQGVRGLAPKHVGRKEIPCKCLQSFKENR